MTLFFISAALLVVLCLLFLLIGLFRSDDESVDQEAVNVTLARERRAILDAALADGSIEQNSFDYEVAQLEYDLAADLLPEQEQKPQRKGQLGAAILVAVFIPISAGALYLHLGNPTAITHDKSAPIRSTESMQSGSTDQSGTQAPALTELLPRLEERLAQSPDDIEGWRLLGRSYLSVNNFAKARTAFEQALALDENDVPTMAQLAESIAMMANGDLAGEATALLERANTMDGSNEHTLWLLSIARQQSGNHAAALAGFDQLATIARDNPEALATIEQMRSRSVREMAMRSVEQSDEQTGDIPTDNTAGQSTAEEPLAQEFEIEQGPRVTVNVDLTPTAKAAVDNGHAVFVYAKATSGPPMPLAVSRHTVAQLPLTITLDDSMAMLPDMMLSSFDNVTIGARISPSGNPIAQSGDWFIEVVNVALNDTQTLTLMIDQQVP